MILRKQMICAMCEELGDLHWETISQNNLTVHNVPIYRCKCGEEFHELRSAAVYDEQVKAAYDCGLDEITLLYPDITYLEWDEVPPEDVMRQIRAELGFEEE
jgi:hypothetical protein